MVHFQRKGLEINLGSIGKGYALDRALTVASDAAPNLLLHGGHSSVRRLAMKPLRKPAGRSGSATGRPQCRRALVHLHNRASLPAPSRICISNTRARSSATYSTRAPPGPPRACSARPSPPQPPPRPTRIATAFFILGVETRRIAKRIRRSAQHHSERYATARHVVGQSGGRSGNTTVISGSYFPGEFALHG